MCNEDRKLLEGCQILLVEDEQAVASLIQDVLQLLGADIVHASRGQQAIRHAREHPVDLVLLDLSLPDMNGLDVIDSLADDYPDLSARTLLVTGDQYRMATQNLIQERSLPVLLKPFHLGELRDAVQQLFCKRSARSAA